MLSAGLRASGLQPVDTIPWGSHLCSFYETPQDLLDLLTSYFRAGLRSNERCMLITAEPVTTDQAMSHMSREIEGFDEKLESGQMVILPYEQWYLEDGVFDMDRVFGRWSDAVQQAIDDGYDGLRVSGNTAWLEDCDWEAFTQYERAIDSAIEDKHILVL